MTIDRYELQDILPNVDEILDSANELKRQLHDTSLDGTLKLFNFVSEQFYKVLDLLDTVMARKEGMDFWRSTSPVNRAIQEISSLYREDSHRRIKCQLKENADKETKEQLRKLVCRSSEEEIRADVTEVLVDDLLPAFAEMKSRLAAYNQHE